MNELISPEFVLTGATVDSRDELIEKLAGKLVEAGRVKETFLQAILDREGSYPTGLPVGRGVAIPHCDPNHVNQATIAIATLRQPVRWGEMAGEEGAEVPVETVFLLALSGQGHLKVLQRIMKAAQDDAFMDELTAAVSSTQIAHLARARFNTPGSE